MSTVEPDPATLVAYDAGASIYAENRTPTDPVRAAAFAEAVGDGRRLDLGCGPGLWFSHLGRPLVGTDASAPMLRLAGTVDPTVPLVRAILEQLPFADGTFAGVWANKCLQHVERADLPVVLAGLYRILTVGGRLDIEAFTGTGTFRSDDDLPGRRFTLWRPDDLVQVLEGARFGVDACSTVRSGDGLGRVRLSATRLGPP